MTGAPRPVASATADASPGGSGASRVWALVNELLAAVPRGRARLAGAVLLAAGASGASVALMGLSGWLLSRAAEMPPVLYLQAAAVGVRFFGISRGVLRYVERLVGHDLALRMQAALRLRTYQSLSRTTLLGRRRGDLLTRVVADVTAVQDLVVRVVVPWCAASLVIVGTTAMMARFEPRSAAALLASSVLAAVVLPWVTQRASRRFDEAAVTARGRLADDVHQVTRSAADLVACGADQQALHALMGLDDDLRRIESRAAWLRGLATAGQVLAGGVAVVAALWFGGRAVSAGDLGARLLAVLVLTPLALHEVFATFTQSAQTWTRSRAALARVVALLDAPPVGRGDVEHAPSARPGVLLEDVTLGWPGVPAPVLEHVTLSVQHGDRVALVGPSGVGKTTLAATVMGMIPAPSGRVESAGRVGYLAQDAHVFATTVAENIRIGRRDASDPQIRDALDRAGLDLPLDRRLGESGRTLSGGEARRLALARVLVGERDLFLLDEPTEHLDRATAEALMADLWRAVGSAPVLVITHDPAVVAACTRVVHLTPTTPEPAVGTSVEL